MSKLFNVDKGLVQKVLDLYFLYCKLELPFKIGDEYEIHEFDLEYIVNKVDTKFDTYRYVKSLNFKIEEFNLNSATLIYWWDELVEFELNFKESPKLNNREIGEFLSKIVKTEILVITVTGKQLNIKYRTDSDWVELTICS